MASEKWLSHKEYARQMRTNAVIADGIIRVSPELWEQVADIIDNSVEAVHGWWEFDGDGDQYCSVCRKYPGLLRIESGNYCPKCGAKMDGGNNNV